MRCFTDLSALPDDARGAAVALGNFDGVHRGHAHLLRHARAARPDLKLAALCFEPHPRELFRPDDPPFRLTLATERAALLAACGVSLLYQLPFNPALAAMPAEDFLELLHDRLGASHLSCGADFAFGHRRGGDAAWLAARATARGIGCGVTSPLREGGMPISSSAIRRLLQDGYPERAAALLGRDWAIRGVVAAGDQCGRILGFPTANVPLGRHLEPARGAYAVTVRLEDGSTRPGVANIGVRPTMSGRESRVEAHLFDWDGDLYGQEIAVALRRHLRPERRFEGIEALRAQIVLDAAQARALGLNS